MSSNQKLQGDVVINDRFKFNGMITGNTTVVSGGHFVLHGTCCKNLSLESGSIVQIHGTVVCDVYNRGGNLEVYGTIRGELYQLSGTTLIAENSMIQGHRINKAESQALSSIEPKAD